MKQSLLLLTMCASAFGSTIYSNISTDTGDTLAYVANGYTQIGDQIHLAGTDRFATNAKVQFFNNGTAGTFDATLRFFQVGAPVGSQIGPDFTLTSIAAPAGNTLDQDFMLPSLFLPDDVVFTVSIGNLSPGVDIIGLDMFEPPTLGSSDNTFAIANDGSNFIEAGTVNENVFFQLDAAAIALPEPATIGFTASALLALALLRRRRPN